MLRLILRPVGVDDEGAVLAAQAAMRDDGFTFAPGYRADRAWPDFLARLAEQARAVEVPGFVPVTFLVAVVGTTIVGRTSVRHRLNDSLLAMGGHIGYGVLRDHRRQGHATEILRQSLVIARSLGVDRALLTCDDDNVGSVRTIERCGGVLENIVDDGSGVAKRRYWLDMPS